LAKNLPFLKFFPGDWLQNANLRRCSHAAKGVWIDMLCLMHQSEERGVLVTAGKPWSDGDIAAALGGDPNVTLVCLHELLDKGVARRDKREAVYSGRMVRDESKRTKCAEAGKKGGGNPTFGGDSKGGRKGANKGGPKDKSPEAQTSERESEDSLRGPPREPDRLRQAVIAAFALNPVTPNDWSRLGKSMKEYRAKGVKPEEVAGALLRYRQAWPNITASPDALINHWDKFGPGAAPLRPAKTPDALKGRW